MEASIRELRASTRAILSSVSRGETVVITHRGKPCARIVPVEDQPDVREADELFGIWKDNDEIASVEGFMKEVRKGRHAGRHGRHPFLL